MWWHGKAVVSSSMDSFLRKVFARGAETLFCPCGCNSTLIWALVPSHQSILIIFYKCQNLTEQDKIKSGGSAGCSQVGPEMAELNKEEILL